MVLTSSMVAAALPIIFLVLVLWKFFTIRKTKSLIIDWPFIGMLPGLLSNVWRIHEYFSQLLQETNHTVEIRGPRFSNMSFILTSDPENIHYILSKNFSNFNKGVDFKDIFDVLGDGIIVADSDSWKMQRRLTHSLFKQRDFLSLLEETACHKVRNGFYKILDHASKTGIEVDMQDLCQRFTFDVTCIFLLGSDLNALSEKLPEVPFAKALDDIEEVLLLRHFKPRTLWTLQRWIQLGVERKAIRAAEIFDDFIYHQISLKRELNGSSHNHKYGPGSECDHMFKNETVHSSSRIGFDLISIFMEEIKPSPSDKFLRDSVMNILSAGRDTSSTALTWFFYLVATNPLVETKLLQELEISFQIKPGEPWNFPSFSELNKLVYLHATICETLRLYPPVPYNHKASIKPDILPSGHQVGKETKILFSVYTMGRMRDIWGADATLFRPERWISNTGNIIDVPSYKFNAFSAGPRTCVGKELAFMEMKIAAAAVIWRYSLRIMEGSHPVTPANAIILHIKHGLKVNVSVRNECHKA